MQATGGQRRIRVLVSANSAVSRAGFESIVRNSEFLELSGSLAPISTLDAKMRELQPDVILVELNHDDREAFDAPGWPAAVASSVSIVVLMDLPEARWMARAVRRGVKSVLPRNASSAEIVGAIQAAHSGLFLLGPEMAHELISRFASEPVSEPAGLVEQLTHREIEVLQKLAEGLGNKQIASSLTISEHTVKFHISSILDKLGASSRTEAVTIGIRMGLVLL